MKLRNLITTLAVAVTSICNAAIYYVSPTGNDNNNGLSPSAAWRTISKVDQSAYIFQPGDQILFQRGGKYYGQFTAGNSGTVALPITIGDYGTGELPIISGCRIVTGWTQHSGNIWKATLAFKPTQVYTGNSRVVPARQPNFGTYYRNTQASGNQIFSNDLTQPAGFWNGCRISIKCTSSTVDTIRVTNYANGTLTLASNPTNSNMGNETWGFFLTGKLALLDSPNEWFWDSSTNQLYLWCANNQNPNNLVVEASTYSAGILLPWMRHHFVMRNLAFEKQTYAGVEVAGAYSNTIQNCVFNSSYFGIRSYGSNNTYTNNLVKNTYATGILAIIQEPNAGTLIENNTLTSIARFIGEGETAWGYMGIRCVGNGITVRLNKLDSIGYTAIECGGNQLIEKNVIKNSMVTLNDGAGIAFDNADGLIVQDNIIYNIVGSFEASQPPLNDDRHNVGVYFGNTSIKNTTVRRNTVFNTATGINVDHTMISSNLTIRDNVLFDNDIQISVSDYSNYNTPNSSPPYYVPNFTDTYENNILYCIRDNQLCMRQYYCHGPNPVDYGTYTNNKYYNPYNDLSIMIYNVNFGGRKWYTFERWKQDRAEDLVGSVRHNFRKVGYSTVQELTPNLTPSGYFNGTMGGWEINKWPPNATITYSTEYLDNGCLRLFIPNNTINPTLSTRSTDQFSVNTSSWYRLKLSTQSPNLGDFIVGVKGQSQLNNPYTLWEKQVPFSSERRDLEMYFKVSANDQATVQLVNQWTEPLYFIDNIDLRQVSKQDVDPLLTQRLVFNETTVEQTIALQGTWKDLDGNVYSNQITLQPFTSKVLIVDQNNQNFVRIKALLSGPYNQSTGKMTKALTIPTQHPYSAYPLIVNPQPLTISQDTIVDWVMLELFSAQNVLLERKVAVISTSGFVLNSNGTNQITFQNPIAGCKVAIKHRNHLGAMLNVPVTGGELLDFTNPNAQFYGTGAVRQINNVAVLWSGDVNMNGQIKYTGSGNDRDLILTAIGGVNPNNVINGYYSEDLNMDGLIKYVGINNDRDLILSTIGGSTPNAVKLAQLP